MKAIWASLYTHLESFGLSVSGKEARERIADFLKWMYKIDSTDNMGISQAADFLARFGFGNGREALYDCWSEFVSIQ
jgi:hypothetical protein